MMKSWFAVLAIAIVAFSQLGASQYLQPESVPGEVIVGLEQEAIAVASQVLSSSLEAFGGEVIDTIPELGAARIRLPEGQEQSFVLSVTSLGDVKYAEPNYVLEASGAPNDPKWDEQWGPAKIRAPEAWEITRGDRRILVAVIDTGVDYTHPDLTNAYVDIGYDFVDYDDDPYPMLSKKSFHGTHVAGIIAAEIGNKVGIAGIANVSIMALRALGLNASGSTWDVAYAIVYAVRHHARVINLSLGGPKSQLLEAAVKLAWQAGCVVVAAAGNTGKSPILYPAAFKEVIAVSAIDEDGKLASFSSYGPEVELAAPGVKILSTFLGADYAKASGTSMATPHVSGVVALMLSANPKLTPAQVRDILHKTAKDLGSPGKDDKYGYGLVDAYAAVQAAKGTRGGEAPPPEPAPSGQLSIATAKRVYLMGEWVDVSYTVPERGRVTIYRVGASSMPEEVYSRTLAAGTYELPSSWRASQRGVETVVIQVRTDGGRVLATAHTYTIGSAPGTVRLWMDKGCGSTYHIGERCTIYFQVDEGCTVRLFDFSSDGRVTKLLEQRLAAGERQALAARVAGPVGTELLVLQAVTSRGVVTAYCEFGITR